MSDLIYEIIPDGVINCDEIILLKGRRNKLTKFINNYRTVLIESGPLWDPNATYVWVTHISIHTACETNLVKIVKLLLSFDDNIEFATTGKGNFKQTALFLACKKGSLEAAKILLSYDYILQRSINKENIENHTPLYISCVNRHHDITKLLLCKGALIDEITKSLNNDVVNNYINNPFIISQWRIDLNINEHVKLFLLTVCISDGYLLTTSGQLSNEVRFFDIVSILPIELQMIICNQVYNIKKRNISSTEVNKTLLDYKFL